MPKETEKKLSNEKIVNDYVTKEWEREGRSHDFLATVYAENKNLNLYAAVDNTGFVIYEIDNTSKEVFELNRKSFSEFKNATVDQFTVKTTIKLDGSLGSYELSVVDGKGKSFLQALEKSGVKITKVERKWWNKLLGFRSKTKWKMAIASIVYLMIFAGIIGAFTGEDQEQAQEQESLNDLTANVADSGDNDTEAVEDEVVDASAEPNTDEQHSPKNDIETAEKIYNDIIRLRAALNEIYTSSPTDVSWASFGRELRSEIDEIRETIEEADIGRNLKYDLDLAAGHLLQLHSEYNKDLQGRGDEEAINYFSDYIEESLNNAKSEFEHTQN